MIRLWHISDVHLSFDAKSEIKKPMDQRSWAKGSDNYVGYLDKIADMGLNEISDSDFVAITGDLTHDAPHKNAVHNINWLRRNINGTLILIRGNHDRAISFPKLRMEFGGRKVHFLDEGEMLTIGPYTFGCFSNHHSKKCREEDGSVDHRYLEIASRIAIQARSKKTTPIMLSHYPVDMEMAEKVGEYGCKAYLSGHIHCTQGSKPGGNDFTWYDSEAKPTDNNVINGCLFSTGTTDVNLQLNDGKIFKHLKKLDRSVLKENEIQSFKTRAAQAFGCHTKFVTKFDKLDPFNKMNMVTGFICRKKDKMQGSLYITHVNGVQTEPQLIYGTPKLDYPYKNPSSREWIDKPQAEVYYLANKWNGMNVLFYKYFDSYGTMFISGKSKGTAFLSDTEVGNFYSLTCEVLGFDGQSIMDDLDARFMYLLDDKYQSMTFELYGKKEPHLVKYDVDIDLAPLFVTDYNGNISPEMNQFGAVYSKKEDIVQVCKDAQEEDYCKNDAYRRKNGLALRYEYEHFATEGRVLYCLDQTGLIKDRTLYKIKPKDVEEVHWGSFDNTMQGRVIEAVNKIKANNEGISEKTLQEELDMGSKEWSRFGKDVMRYIHVLQNINERDNREVLVLVGLPASGKSTFAKKLEEISGGKYVRINQDDLGSSNKCKGAMVDALKKNKSVIVDRVNFNEQQRKRWVDLALKLGVTNVNCVVVDQTEEICKKRIVEREEHPTVPQGEKAVKVVDNFIPMMKEPTVSEGFGQVIHVHGDEKELQQLIDELLR